MSVSESKGRQIISDNEGTQNGYLLYIPAFHIVFLLFGVSHV